MGLMNIFEGKRTPKARLRVKNCNLVGIFTANDHIFRLEIKMNNPLEKRVTH